MSHVDRDPGVSVLSVRDADRAVVAPLLRSALGSADADSTPVIVDLTAATSIDATIVGILLEGLVECERRERTFLLLLPAEHESPVTRVFKRMGLAGLLPVVSSWDEAYRRAGAA